MNDNKPPQVPANTPEPIRGYLVRLVTWAGNELRRKQGKEEAVASVLLVSPNGSVYSIAVLDNGSITSTQVSGP